MEETKVSEFLISYLKEKNISAEQVSKAVGVDASKLKPGYQSPLSAEEFLEICVYLELRPEYVADAIKQKK